MKKSGAAITNPNGNRHKSKKTNQGQSRRSKFKGNRKGKQNPLRSL